MIHRAFTAFAFSVLTLIFVDQSQAASLSLAGEKRWLAVASSKDLDTAIGIGRAYGTEPWRVVSSKSGWFAVVLGPYSGASVEQVLKANPNIGEVPRDARLSRGENYLETVWDEPRDAFQAMTEYEIGKPARFSAGPLNFVVSMAGTQDAPGATSAEGTKDGKAVFSFHTDDEYSQWGSEAAVLRLDPQASDPQLVFTRFTGGAHCCTQTWVATKPQGQEAWTLVEADVLDGGGYAYKDLDGDGVLEFMSVDNSFLYAFDSYAGSFAPVRVSQLRGGKLQDVSNDPAFRSELKRDLARMEFSTKLDPQVWRANGFLAGWLAAKMRLGQGDEAWQVVTENADRKSDFGPQVCKTGKPVETCDFDDLERVPVLKALAQFMAERDYGELPPAARALLGPN